MKNKHLLPHFNEKTFRITPYRTSFFKLLIVILGLSCFSTGASGETVFFLVAETTPYHNDSYVLPLTDPNDIAYARNLIEFGTAPHGRIVVADIACGSDGINRNFLSPTKSLSPWHVTNFLGFADFTIEILDGWPGFVTRDCQGWVTNTGGSIGFWTYTVVAELGTDPRHWNSDFPPDGAIDGSDLAQFSHYWLNEDCNDATNWCDGRDLDKSQKVDLNDLGIIAQNWLSQLAVGAMWFDCWDNSRQCHGDADGQAQGGQSYWVYTNDVAIFSGCWPIPIYYFEFDYDPRADFDRDGDIDEDDGAILDIWLGRSDVPVDCPTEP